LAMRTCSRLLTKVVLPTPGPPVMMATLLRMIRRTACRCESERDRPVWPRNGSDFMAPR
jgi:hypothetical protein